MWQFRYTCRADICLYQCEDSKMPFLLSLAFICLVLSACSDRPFTSLAVAHEYFMIMFFSRFDHHVAKDWQVASFSTLPNLLFLSPFTLIHNCLFYDISKVILLATSLDIEICSYVTGIIQDNY